MAEGLGHYGIELLGQFEPGPDGKPATEAYECGGGRWTLGLGATTWPNGKAIKPGDFCTPEQAIELTNWHVRRFAKVVDDTIQKPMTTNQRDAMIIMAYNVGPEAFAASSVARRFNDGDVPRHIAEAFGMWCKATNDNPDKYDLREPIYQEVIGRNADGDPIWVGPKINPPDGWKVQRIEGEFWGVDPKDETQKVPLGIRPRPYRRAYPGLLRRHLSEACLFLDLDWRQACRKETVSITANRIWDSEDRRWEDLVRKKTELPDILPLALPYPLSARSVPVGADFGAPLPNQPTPIPVDVAPVPDSARAIPDTPASSVRADDTAGQPEPATQPKAPAAPAPNVKEPAKSSPDALVASNNPPVLNTTPAAPSGPLNGATGRAVESKAAPTVPPPPVVAPPLPKDAAPANLTDPKDMVLSRRFWGLAVTAVGTTNFLPRGVSDYINNEGNRELLTWLIVVVVGFALYKYGQRKASKPLK